MDPSGSERCRTIISDDGTAEGDEPGFGRLLPHRARRRSETAHTANYGITNTMVWLPDGRFVAADTTKNALYAFDYGRRPKHIEPARLFGRLPARISRRLVSRRRGVPLELPCCRRCLPRSLCAGREGRSRCRAALHLADELHIRRSGSHHAVRDLRPLHDDRRTPARNPLEGGLFALETGVAGRPEPLFGG